MIRNICIICLLLSGLMTEAQIRLLPGGQAQVSNLDIARTEGNLFVSMNVDWSGLEIKGNREMFFTPVLCFGEKTLTLPSILVAGRNRYYHHLRSKSADSTVMLYRRSEVTAMDYRAVVPYESWMNESKLVMDERECGCCSDTLAQNRDTLVTLNFAPKVFRPQFVYIPPKAEMVKMREMKGSAYIDFPVNRTEIHENYRSNYTELQKIRNTIDVVRNDADTRITSVFIKGYASPEGAFANNVRLAKGRTQTLKEYVRKQYAFPDTLLTTDFEAEDWSGLERYVAASGLSEKEGILALIGSDLEPDVKERKIKQMYPADYAYLYRHVYPGLRHSDYVVEYEVRAYTDVEEVKRLLRTQPQKLSLQEMYVAAQDMVPGSDEYNETFEIAVRMFPDDSVANLNAANTAMGLGDLKNAARYLEKAGDSAEAVYARAIYAALNNDYDTAARLFADARQRGIAQAADALKQLQEMKK